MVGLLSLGISSLASYLFCPQTLRFRRLPLYLVNTLPTRVPSSALTRAPRKGMQDLADLSQERLREDATDDMPPLITSSGDEGESKGKGTGQGEGTNSSSNAGKGDKSNAGKGDNGKGKCKDKIAKIMESAPRRWNVMTERWEYLLDTGAGCSVYMAEHQLQKRMGE